MRNLKICIIGSDTQLNHTFGNLTAERKWITNYLPTLGHDFPTKKITIGKTPIKLILMIVAGESQFKSSRASCYRGASGCVILFDKGRGKTFTQVTRWLAEFRKSIPYPEIPMALVGIKREDATEDLVTPEEGQQLAEKLQIAYYETTLTDKPQVEYILTEIAKKALTVKEASMDQES